MIAGTVTIDDLVVHVNALLDISHFCRPFQCRNGTSCCECYQVTITSRELSRIIGMIGPASRYAKHLCASDGHPEVFEESEGGLELGTDETGRCIFAYRHHKGESLCSIHSAAMEMNLNPYEIKPQSCTLWPLMISETPPRELAVTPDAFEFPCNKRRPKDQTKLDEGIANILTIIFGPQFVEKFHAAIADDRYETAGSDTCKS